MSKEGWFFRGKPSEITKNLQELNTEKYQDIPLLLEVDKLNKSGTARFVSNEFKEFKGYPENPFVAEFNVAMLWGLTPYFTDIIYPKLLSIEENLGVGLYLAGRDFPLHTTIWSGKDKGAEGSSECLAKRQRKFNALQEDKRLLKSIDSLEDLKVDFTYLAVMGGDLILTAPYINRDVVKARANLTKIYTSYDLEPKHLTLLHLTLARVSSMPNGSGDFFTSYLNETNDLKRQILDNPLTLSGNVLACASARMIQDQYRLDWQNPAPSALEFTKVR